jgi:hypothetical protein
MGLIGDRLIEKGFDRLRFELKAVALQFSRDDWIAIYDEAAKPMLGEGHYKHVRPDPDLLADAQQPLPEGQGLIGRKAQYENADGKPIASGGHDFAANSAKSFVPPVRGPSAADIAAMEKVENIGFSEIVKIRGKLLGRYSFGQLKNARAMNLYENLIIQELQEWREDKKISDDMLIERTVPQADLKKIIERCKRAIHSSAKVANG